MGVKFFHFSEKSYDLSVYQIDLLGGGMQGETGHGHHLARQHHHKACACGNAHFTDGEAVAGGCAQLFGIVGERILCFCHADGEIAVAQSFDVGNCLLGGGEDVNALGVVDLGGNGVDLLGEGCLSAFSKYARAS